MESHYPQNRWVSEYHEVIKSPSDHKNYRALVLTNQLKVLLTSDPSTKKGAASLSVAVGSLSDPPNVQGVAHLCEHMLFIETENDVRENNGTGYSKFISENGGASNAFTTRDQTNYHFDVNASVFVEALTRFSKFFTTTPEFSDDGLVQEIKVINSEYENRLTNEGWRKMAVEAAISHPGHPFAQFSTGNFESLRNRPLAEGINVLQYLKNFHSQFYSSSIMSLVVLSKEHLDTLEEHVARLFSGVQNINIVAPMWSNNPYGPEECQTRVDIVPIGDVRDLYMFFQIPDSRPWFKTFPHGYLSNLLGHKGPGSLFSLLSRKQWINNTYLSSSVPGRGFGALSIGIQLTVEGLEHIEEIVEIVFSYIAMLKANGPQKYFWEELQTILKIQFNFVDHENPIDFVQKVSNLLHVYPIQNVLSVGYLIEHFDEDVINEFANCLNATSCRIMTITKANDKNATKKEMWYGVKYQIQPINSILIQKWKDVKPSEEMKLPPRNLFIPSKFDLKYTPEPALQTVPRRICEDNGRLIKAWFYQDHCISVPKAFIRFELYSRVPMVDPLAYNCNNILAMMFKESISEELYSAILAGLNYTIKGTLYGMEITVDGYDERIGVLTDTILQRLMTMDFDALSHIFQGQKDSYENGLKTAENLPPCTQIPYYMSLLMRERRFSNEDLVTATNDLNVDQIRQYYKQFMEKLNVECIIYGNFTECEAIGYAQYWDKMFKDCTSPVLPSQSFRFREIQIPLGTSWFYKKMLSCANRCSCCAVLIQVGLRNMKDNVLLELFDQIIHEPCFNQLRNQEQLGYIVRTSVRKSNGTQGFLINVQGVLKPELIHQRIETFLGNFKEYLQDMPSETFARHKSSVVLSRNDAPKKLTIRANRLWNNEIYTREYNFTRDKDEILFLQTVNVAHLISFYDEFINPASADRKSIAVYLESPLASEDNLIPTMTSTNSNQWKEVLDITHWKSNMTLSPLF